MQAERQAPISVTLTKEGALYVNKQPVTLRHLGAVLKRHPNLHADTGVLLFADREVEYQQLFEVLDRIRKAGLHRISLQAESRGAP